MGDDEAARAAGLMVIEPGTYLTAPTRRHRVLVRWEDGRWITWAGIYRTATFAGGGDGAVLVRERILYRGTSLDAALRAATRFADGTKR